MLSYTVDVTQHKSSLNFTLYIIMRSECVKNVSSSPVDAFRGQVAEYDS